MIHLLSMDRASRIWDAGAGEMGTRVVPISRRRRWRGSMSQPPSECRVWNAHLVSEPLGCDEDSAMSPIEKFGAIIGQDQSTLHFSIELHEPVLVSLGLLVQSTDLDGLDLAESGHQSSPSS
jgi:hypothetical protein